RPLFCAYHLANCSQLRPRHPSCFSLRFGRAGIRLIGNASLRVTIATAAGAAEALVGRPPHDADNNRRHTTLNRTRLRYWNLFRFHAAVEPENAAFHRNRMDMSM